MEKITEKVSEKGTDKGTEMLDAWMKSQNEFMQNCVKGQKEFIGHWTEATKKLQGAVAGLGSSQEGPAKEMFNQYNTWLSTMIKSSEVMTEEASKMQGAWVNTVEKQMETFKNFATLCKQPTAAK